MMHRPSLPIKVSIKDSPYIKHSVMRTLIGNVPDLTQDQADILYRITFKGPTE
jgi:hypothetical protein